MNNFDETRIRPAYSYRIQKAANSLPFWAKGKTDKHSNYQSVLSDLGEPIEDLIFYAKKTHAQQYTSGYDTNDSMYLYRYMSDDLLKVQKENTVSYVEPSSVKISENFGEYILTKCPYPSIGDLNNRLPLFLKNVNSSNVPFEIIQENLEKKEYLILIKEFCYIGFRLVHNENAVTDPEDFFLIQNGQARYSLAYLKNYFKKPVEAIRVLPNIDHSFPHSIPPGFYYLNFDLLDSSQLDNYSVSIYCNHAYPLNKTIYHDSFVDNDFAADSYLKIEDEYLNIKTKNFNGVKEEETLDTYILLDENDEAFICSSWVKKDMLLYALSESGDKLYIYNLFQEGNSYIYEDNHEYILDITCDKIDYRVGDTIQIETRATGMVLNQKINGIRLKIENKESGDTYYINKTGAIFDETSPYTWRNYQESSNSVDSQIRWKFDIDNIGSYKVTCEAMIDNGKVIVAGVKLFLVNYKTPYRIVDLGESYSGYYLGINPNEKIEMINYGDDQRKILEFEKDGYFFETDTGIIWTNIQVPQLIVEY